MRSVSGDREQAVLFRKGTKSLSGLSESERFRFDPLMRSLILQVGVAGAARERGLSVAGAEGDTRVIEGTFLRLLEQPGFREWWERTDRKGIPGPTADLIDQLATGE